MQCVHSDYMQTTFLLPWKIPWEISLMIDKWSMLYNIKGSTVSNVCQYNQSILAIYSFTTGVNWSKIGCLM